jgi:hypothetical protein
MTGGGAGTFAPREPSTASWSVGATATDSPGRYSLNDSNKGTSVPRGDSLAYSDDSHDAKALMLKGSRPNVTQQVPRNNYQNDGALVARIAISDPKKQSGILNESRMSQDSLRERSQSACCVVQ